MTMSVEQSGVRTVAEFGTWKSPISSKLATESSVVFQEVHVDNGSGGCKDTIYWSELRFDEGGRCVVCSKKNGQSNFTAWTPSAFNARTRVHEYGGGSWFVHNNAVYFSNFADQRMYVQKSADSEPVPITPANCGWRYADGAFSEKLNRIFCVREDHSKYEISEVKEPSNEVVVINPDTQQQYVLASGANFYSSPRVTPDGRKICWVQWNHPNMPWDSTEIWVASLSDSGDAVVENSAKKTAGGEGISVMHSSWSPDNDLLYISDKTDYWNLYHLTKSGEQVNLAPREKEIGGPHWTFGGKPYVFDTSDSSNLVFTCEGKIHILDTLSTEIKTLDMGYKSYGWLQYSSDGYLYCIAGSPNKFPCLVRLDLQSEKVDVLHKSRSLTFDDEYLSIPEEIKWPTGPEKDKVSYGHLYPPKNKDFRGPESSLPPLLVKAHGGPTGHASDTLNLRIQYFTSRGFAVLDVNYRGSTGYGKQYRNELRSNWGICDIEDCCSGAQYLADTKKCDGNRLCIDGGSAGGFTTLACLTFSDVFKAGASHYGVADLGALVRDTHKFESRYLDLLIGPYPESKDVHDARSPIFHVDKLNCPIALFQGDEDKIVPPNQAEMMYEAVKAKGLPTVYVLFKGEQHGFRKAENIQKALDGEFYFFAKVFGFEPADDHCKLDIINLQ